VAILTFWFVVSYDWWWTCLWWCHVADSGLKAGNTGGDYKTWSKEKSN